MKNNQHQSGFTLLELIITVIIAGMMILAMIQMQTYQAQLEKARAVAQTYQKLNQAVGTYMVNHYDAILRAPTGCNNLPFRGATSVVPIALVPNGCGGALPISATAGGPAVQVANLRQPTLQELRAAGYLDSAIDAAAAINTLPLPTFATAPGHPNHIVGAQNNAAPASFWVVIDTPNPANVRDLRSLVFNLQPYNLANNNFGGDGLLDQILLSAGADAFLSGGDATGNLRPQDSGAANSAITNPLTIRVNNNQTGAPNVLAMRNGYGSSGFDRYVRRDGSTPLTADWNVGNQSITGIKNVGTTTVTATGAISGASVTATGAISGASVAATGAITGGTGVFGAVNNQIVAALKATTAYVQDTLTVGVRLLVQGDTQLDGALNVGGATTLNTLNASGATSMNTLNASGATSLNTLNASGATTLGSTLNVSGNTSLKGVNVDDFKLNEFSTIDTNCSLMTQTIAKNRDTSNQRNRLLYCAPGISERDPTGTWRPAIDVDAVLTGINTSISGINGSLNTINENVAANTDNVAKLKSDVTRINDQELSWEIINVNWDAAANTRVWKKTPWSCSQLGKLDDTGQDSGVRYLKDASANQLTTTFTMPMVVGIDRKPLRDTHVFDFNCVTQSQAAEYGVNNTGAFWYVGMSSVQSKGVSL